MESKTTKLQATGKKKVVSKDQEGSRGMIPKSTGLAGQGGKICPRDTSPSRQIKQ